MAIKSDEEFRAFFESSPTIQQMFDFYMPSERVDQLNPELKWRLEKAFWAGATSMLESLVLSLANDQPDPESAADATEKYLQALWDESTEYAMVTVQQYAERMRASGHSS